MPAWSGERYESILSGPPQPLTEILPKRALESIEPPTEPVRVATRAGLPWRPALQTPAAKPAAEADAPPRQAAPQAATDRADAPRLVAPGRPARSGRAGDQDAGVLLSTPAVTASPAQRTPDPSVLPLQAPRVSADAQAPEGGSAADTRAPEIQEPEIQEPEIPEEEDRDTRFSSSPAADADPVTEPSEEPARVAPPKSARSIASAEAEEAPSDAVAPRQQAESAATKRPRVEAAPKTAAEPASPPPPLSRSMVSLRARLRTVLSYYYSRPLNTAQNDPWELMHAMLAYELHSRVRDGGPQGPYLTAVGHLCFNRPSAGKRMMVVRDDGTLDVEVGVSLQGHRGQFLAMLAQCNVSPDYPIRVDGREFTIHDLIEAEQRTCYPGTELTFKLIGLGHYLDSDARWTNDRGEAWDIPRLIAEERGQPIRGAACGGTHRLAGLSLAYRRREARGEKVDGEYAEAQKFVAQYEAYAFRLQNDDGSLSTSWFRGPGDEDDIDRRLRTTGHTLEWLVYSLSDDELRSYRSVRAVNYLTNLLAGHADHEWHLGSIAHALHALVLYDKRVFRPHDTDASGQVAAAVDPTGRLYREYPIYRGVMRNSPPEPSGLFGIFGGSRTGSAASRRR
ncbi:hypothetical protein [Botrimarina sp.]|uniref:hypothetical protein n=1 Tax=Botrimarina sp. TaxID=2795802 RepID=UPI0032ED4323